MIEPVKILDDFYKPEEFGLMFFEANINNFNQAYQPNSAWVSNRLHAYPCYETKKFLEETYVYSTTFKKLNMVLDNKVEKIETLFRKTYLQELKSKSIYKNMSMKHQDEEWDMAAVLYFNNFNIMDGTKLYTKNKDQLEPDLVVGAKPNRLIIYNTSTWHEPCIDFNTEVRIIQVVFIKIKKEF
jgi:hypothetical protein